MAVTHEIKVRSENSQKATAPPSRCSRRKAVLAHKATLVTRVIHHQLLLGPTLARQARKRQQKEREEKKLRAARKRNVNPANKKFSPSAQQSEPITAVTPTKTHSSKDEEATRNRTTKAEPAPTSPVITSTPKVPPRKMSAMAPTMGRSLPEAPCLKYATGRHKLPPETPTSISATKHTKAKDVREEAVRSTEQVEICKKHSSPAKPVLSRSSLTGRSSTSGGVTHAATETTSSRLPKTRKNAKTNRSRQRDDNQEERGSVRRKKRRTRSPQTCEERERVVIDITESPPPVPYEDSMYPRAVASPYEGAIQASPLRSVWVDNSALMDLLMSQHAAGTNRQRRHWILETLVGATDAATILAALSILNSLYDPAQDYDPVVDRVVIEAKLLSCRSVQGIVADTLTQLNRGRDGLLSTMESMSWGSILGKFIADRLRGNELVETEHLLSLGLSPEQAANIMPTVRLLEGRTHLEYVRLEQQLSFVQRDIAAVPGLSLQVGPPLSQFPLYLF